MFNLVMFKQSPKTISIGNANKTSITYRVLKRNENVSHKIGILSGGLFPKKTEMIQHKKKILITEKKPKTVITKPLLDNINYYNIKGNRKCDIIFVTSNKGIFKSIDYGKNWLITDAPKKHIQYNCLLVSQDGQNIIAGANKGSFLVQDTLVVYSHDYGITWGVSKIKDLKNNIIRKIVEYDDELFFVTEKGLLFKSKDKGINWKQINSLKKGYYNSLCSTTSKLFLIKNSNDISYLLGSRTHGITWYNLKKINRAYNLLISKNQQNFIYINYSKPNYNIYVSKSYGKVWKKTFSLKSRIYLVSDENCKNVVCVSVKNKVLYISNNYGMTWKKIKPQNFKNNLVLMNHDNTFQLAL